MRRQFVRFGLSKNVRLTFFDDVNIGFIRLSKLKWLETNTIDIGGGGMLVKVPVFVSEDDYVVLNLGIEGFSMPKLLVGRIRHKQRDEENRTNIGIEFIVREGNSLLLPKSLVQNLPPQLFDFDEHKRKELAHFLGEKYRHFLEDKE
ncbi:MAG: hypothetical protein NTV06_09695 [candidate division Zixibacteria bacterium]|nr:hypothetical protein [candidate division Zixibacteria bacterium]